MSQISEPSDNRPPWDPSDEELGELLRHPVPTECIFGDRLIKALIAETKDQAEVHTTSEGNTVIAISGEKSRDVEALISQFPIGPSPELLGQLNEYTILDIIGTGGMGIVLSARDTNLDRDVAIKVMKPSYSKRPDARKRFVREAKAAAAILNDNVVAIHHVGFFGETPYFVMPLLKGESLRQHMRRHSLDPENVLEITRQIALGLTAAHSKKLLHRDIKPENIWLESETNRVKILDFGIVKLLNDDLSLTSTGTFIGTLSYASPELVNGKAPDERSDLFSLGAVLHELLSGNNPFERDSIASTIHAISFEPCPTLQPQNDELGDGLVKLANDLLAKDPNDRPANADSVVKRLVDLKSGLEARRIKSSSQNDSEFGPNIRPAYYRRRNTLIAVGVVAILLLGSLLLTFAMQDGTGTLVVKATDGFDISTVDNKIRVRDLATGREYRMEPGENQLKPGEYEVLVTSDDGLHFSTDKFSIVRNGVEKLSVWSEPPSTGPFPNSGSYTDLPSRFVESAPAIPGVENWTMETRLHRGLVTGIGLDREEKFLASTGMDGTVRLWDPNSLELQRILLNHRHGVRGLAWSPTEDLLATFDETEIIVWDIDGSRLIHRFSVTASPDAELKWSSDGSYLSIVGVEGDAKIWDIREGKLVSRLGPGIRAIQWIDGRTDIQVLWTNGKSEIRNAVTCETINSGHDFNAHLTVQYSPNGQLAVQNNTNTTPTISVIDSVSNKDLGSIDTFVGSAILRMWWLPDSRKLLCLDHNGIFRMWDTETKQLVESFESVQVGHHDDVRVCFSKKQLGEFYFSVFNLDQVPGVIRGSMDGSLRTDPNQRLSYGTGVPHDNGGSYGHLFYDFCFSHDNERILVPAPGVTLDSWKNNGEYVKPVQYTRTSMLGAINELADGKILFMDVNEAGSLRSVYLVDPPQFVDYTQTPLVPITSDLSEPYAKLAPDNGAYAFYSPTTKKLSWVQIETDERRTLSVELNPSFEAVDFQISNAPNPRVGIVVRDTSAVSESFSLVCLDFEDSTQVFRIDNLGPESVFDWSPDKSQLIIINDLGEIKIHDAETGELIEHPLNDRSVSRWVWSPDGTQIVLVDHQGIGQLWDVQKQEFDASFKMVCAGSRVLKWSHDGKLLGNVSDSGMLTIHSAQTGARTGLLVYAMNQRAYWFANDGHFMTQEVNNEQRLANVRDIRMVVMTSGGEQNTYDSQVFANRFGWKNERN